ncbi:helix-turn-helix transcriptional regulator [Niabella sp.]|uniref:helix-turn-helix domain-containing protein n=1 Tax=Niabella sp. TaxID=1962976 RepID=UPI00261439CF|nr:helix-turn-helix transcriptional regulator [Niabella sp.]
MKQIRKAFNLSQQELALLLNVSRSTIAHYENGLRSLPAGAAEKWLALQQQWQQSAQRASAPQTSRERFLQVQHQQSLDLLNMHQQRAAARSVSITQQLTAMEEQYARLINKLYILKRLVQEAPAGSRRMELLANRLQLTLIQLSECCPQRRQLLAFKLQVLTAQQKAALAGKVIVQQQG